MSNSQLLARARAVGEVAQAHSAEGESLRRLPAPVVAALRDAELLRMGVPAAYRGPEVDPVTMLACMEDVARADGAAGWCTMIATTTSSLSMFLPPEWAGPIFSDPAVITGGVFAPNGRATDEGDHWRVDGRWMWGSGTQHCQWIVGGAMADDGSQHVMFFPAEDVTFHDTWHTHGLRGTGSLDFSVEGAKVPKGRSVIPASGARYVDSPLAAFPNFTLLAIGVAAVTLGIGRRAIDEILALGVDKRPQFSQRTIAQMGTNQSDLARAEARLSAARAYLFDEVGQAWQAVLAGQHVDVDRRARMRLAGAHAAETAAAVVDTAYTMAGGTSVFEASALQRCLRDVHVATQHIMVAPRLYETMGKHLFGLPIESSMI
ncbi:MAG: acyl-CoA dehydrogenase family protein [Ilumatobacteraceae bacterium]|nr:acyl-CoA dehydrogenase family protein [Ilumatobacter sp.]MCB9379077.1 acyl-CoA dehydrogenase family protein [Acidimicrobiaceae bacterium]MCO5330926.1 acyl-CoA dehydrogenase family protein [Ilumatobacteraceae bacterium]